MVRRETIIALRARHTAYRVSTDMLFPAQAPPEPVPVLKEVKPPPPLPTPEEAAAFVAELEARRAWAEQVLRRTEEAWLRRERRQERGARIVAIIAGAAMLLFSAFAITVGIIEGKKDSQLQPTTTTAVSR